MGTCCSALKSNVIAGRNDAAPKANGHDVHDDTAEAYGNQLRNRLKSLQVRIFELRMILCLSGTTSLVNSSTSDIEFYTKGMGLSTLRFRLKASHTEHINMRKFFAFREALAAETVELKVGGHVKETFTPEDFVINKKIEFQLENEELIYKCDSRMKNFASTTARE